MVVWFYCLGPLGCVEGRPNLPCNTTQSFPSPIRHLSALWAKGEGVQPYTCIAKNKLTKKNPSSCETRKELGFYLLCIEFFLFPTRSKNTKNINSTMPMDIPIFTCSKILQSVGRLFSNFLFHTPSLQIGHNNLWIGCSNLQLDWAQQPLD